MPALNRLLVAATLPAGGRLYAWKGPNLTVYGFPGRQRLCLPGARVGLTFQVTSSSVTCQAFDLGTWEPLGSFPDPGLRRLDPVARRLYAWRGSTLSVLGYGGD